MVADDGSGSPSPAFLQIVTNAVNAVRPLAIQFTVFAPVTIWAVPSLQVATAPGYDHQTVVAQVAALMALNINSLGLGNSLPYTKLAGWAYSIPGVTDVTAVLLNGASGDSASINAYRLAVDGNTQIGYATIKCQSVIIS